MEQEQLKNTLEAILFVASKPLRSRELAKILEVEEAEIKTGLNTILEEKKTAGIILMDNNGEYQLATNSAYSTKVKNFLNAELREKLTDATVEVLAIIAYRQPISKAEIEAIRGVNSQYSLRNLLMRGMIEKVANPGDARSFLYQTTTEFLMHLGMASVKDLPDFTKLVENIKLPQTPGLTGEPNSAPSTETVTDEVSVKIVSTSAEPAKEIKIASVLMTEDTNTETKQEVTQENIPVPKIEQEITESNEAENEDNEDEEDDKDEV